MDLSITAILKELYAGKKLMLQFPTVGQRDTFRTALYRAKAAQDKILTDVLDEVKDVLKFEATQGTECDEASQSLTVVNIRAKIWLEKKPPPQEFEVIEIEE